MKKRDQVEDECTHLSPLLKNIIRQKVLKRQEPPAEYTFGEALAFWVADLLLGVKLVTGEQVRVVLEEYGERICAFGDSLQRVISESPNADIPHKRLPVCKIGILDRQYICMDGCETFLNINTGERVPAAGSWPLETVVYNLTVLVVKHTNSIQLN